MATSAFSNFFFPFVSGLYIILIKQLGDGEGKKCLVVELEERKISILNTILADVIVVSVPDLLKKYIGIAEVYVEI